MVGGLPTPRAARMYSDEQRAQCERAVAAAWNALLSTIEATGHYSDETDEASAEYRRALDDLGVVDGWRITR